jgi:hypothetical protein
MDVLRVLATALVMASACTTAPSKDDQLRDRLVGKWAEARHFANAHEQQSIELSGNGLIRIERTYHDGSGTSRTVLQGKWRVENGDFVYHTSESCDSVPGTISAECRQRIVAVTDWEWVMEEGRDGAEFRAWRYPK